MAKVTLTAIHRIAHGKPKGDGTLSYVEAGETFALDEADAKALIASGAAEEVKAEEKPAAKKSTPKKAAPKKAATKEPEGDGGEGGEGGEGGDDSGGDDDLV